MALKHISFITNYIPTPFPFLSDTRPGFYLIFTNQADKPSLKQLCWLIIAWLDIENRETKPCKSDNSGNGCRENNCDDEKNVLPEP